MRAEIAKLREEIIVGFAQRPPLTADEISECSGHEGSELKEDFDEIAWWAVDQTLIYRNFAQLPFFTPKAFHYFLPAYLIYALDHFDEYDPVFEYSMYALSPVHLDGFFEERKVLFSKTETRLLIEFLRLVLGDASMKSFHKDAALGLEIWKM